MPSPSPDILNIINSAADANGIPRNIALALATKENPAFDNSIVGPANNNGSHDYGLFQLNGNFFPSAPNMSPVDNANTAMGLLASLKAQFGNWFDTFRAYNAGATAARNSGTISSGYAQSVSDLAGLSTAMPGTTDATTSIDTAVATGLPLTYPAFPMAKPTLNNPAGTTQVPSNVTPDATPQDQGGFIGAIRAIADSIAAIPSKIGASINSGVATAENNTIAGVKNWAGTSGLNLSIILLAGAIVTIGIFSTITSDGGSGSAPSPKLVPIPV